ncbi:MAG TPA: amidase [Thermodesulfobacteriota bacterium]
MIASAPHGDLAFLGLAEASRRLAEGGISAVDLTEAMLARIEALNPRLNAFLAVEADRARAAARESDARRAAGRARGPLDGIPIAVKDIVWRAGRPMTAGAKRPVVERAPEDATVVARLEAAGAIILGATGLHEFAYGVTSVNPHHGPVRNPWAIDRNPGGSSGGSGAAVAAGLAYGALGTDTGGSIRIPASVCGIVGLKPTYGRVSRHGVFPLAWSLDHVGPMTRRVEDAALLLEAIAGADPADPTASRRPVPAYASRLGRSANPPLAGLRVGVPRGFFFDRAEPEVAGIVRAAIDRLAGLGAAVREVALPKHEASVPAALLVLLAEAAAVHARRLAEAPGDYGEDVRARLEQGRLVPASDYLAAQRARAVVRRELAEVLREVDCIATPTTPTTAGPLSEGASGPADAARRAMTHFTRPFNLTGFPALSMPCGFTAEGLPVGLQLVGRPFEEGTLLAAAAPLEAALGLTARRPTA